MDRKKRQQRKREKNQRLQQLKERPIVVGVGWYRADQWQRLLEVSEDRTQMENTHAEWLGIAERTLREDLPKAGLAPRKVDVDVEELLAWCHARNRPVNGEARAEFINHKLRLTCEAEKDGTNN